MRYPSFQINPPPNKTNCCWSRYMPTIGSKLQSVRVKVNEFSSYYYMSAKRLWFHPILEAVLMASGGGEGDLVIMMCWWATASPCLQLSGWSPGLRLWYWGGRQKYLSCKGRGDQNSERKQIKRRQIVLFKGPAQSPRIYTERRFNIQHTPLENTNQSPLHPQRAELMQTRPCEEGWGKRRERKTAPPGMRNLRLVTFGKTSPN